MTASASTHVVVEPADGWPRRQRARASILLVDDDESFCEAIEATLASRDLEITSCTSARAALALVTDRDFDAMLADVRMPAMDGIELCGLVQTLRPEMSLVVVTGHADVDVAISAIRAGVRDFVVKPVDNNTLTVAVDRAVQHRRLRDEVKRLRQAASPSKGQMVGESTAMQLVFDMVARLAESDASVLITGESGTGKELIARALHTQGPRKDGPFVAVNCAAVPAALLESELFGHARSAFTDAKAARTGLFMEASGGTLFLDEIGELPLEMQPKILRALQERTVRRIGETVETPFDTRIVTATNRSLEQEVEAKRFRRDLYYRINVVRLDAPPLRARGSDVLLLAQHFVARFAARSGKPIVGINADAAAKLLAYEWPGNVRELENCMERAVALVRFDQVTVDDLPAKIQKDRAVGLATPGEDPDEIVTMAELTRRYALRVLALVAGNKSQAAELLGIDRRTLYRRLDRYESDRRR